MILVTGGAGYIGSHACVELLDAGYELVVLDNLSNSKHDVLQRVEDIAGKKPIFVEGDIRDAELLDAVFSRFPIDAVLHFAGLKAVGESVEQPLRYYDNNVSGSLRLVEAMQRHGVKTLVFSSSATVYGDPHAVPISEDFPLQPTNPYGRSKLMVEDMLRDLHHADPEWRIAILRYFNPVGAHDSGLIGEDPNGVPNNLLPYIAQVAVGKLAKLRVFGDDYPTPDGTGVRDYIHVVDLARGHLKALEALRPESNLLTVNLGTGRGYSVLEMVKAFAAASGRAIPYEVVARRPGDIAECRADPTLAERLIGWKADKGLDEMCASAWKWQQSQLG
ncbi:UDP-glucose 4-epimerase GalE [Crenobacter cavernae]|uniref:UDP-glucose 4-epimerase n=1 Tax=Crenobacter cavernae TaxID=2290923 RepID=A0ABY0FFB4_9NEIS|nr:UDP-glucose 4-epimerase GalE [Crenobacter cavernae]RXZ43454.1 UDP-glucose 4-epimerase GalE [Crenobacter cavernae]